MTRESRVTIDIDPYDPRWRFRALRAAYELQSAADEVEVRISSSGKGIHIIGWFDERLDDDAKFRMRRHLTDDPNRIQMDKSRERHGHVKQVLWSWKSGKGSADGDFERIEDVLDHLSKTMYDSGEMLGDFVNHGRKAWSRHRHVSPSVIQGI